MIRHHEIFLAPPFSELWKDADPFAEAAALEGEEFRKVKSRRTFRFEVEGRGFFAKIHHGVGWREIFKNLFQFKPNARWGEAYLFLAEYLYGEN